MNMRGFMRDLSVMKKSGSKAAERVSRKWQQVGGQFQRVGGMLTAGLTAPLVGAGALALKTAADYESLRMSMNVLNKSVKEGARNFKRLKEFSAETPFQLRDLAQAQNMLQGFGLSADNAFQSMKMIGDIAAVASGDIKGIGIAFGQAAAEGRLMTRDIRQLINQGVPAIKLLADTMDVAKSEVLDLASEGKISFEILQQAFKDATSEGGMFANGMAKQAETLSGVWSTLKDNFSLALGEIGKALSEAFDIKQIAKDLISNLKSFTKWFSNLNPVVQKTSFIVAGLVASIGPLSIALGTIISLMPSIVAGFSAIFSPISLATAAIAGFIVIGKNLYDNWETIAAELVNLWDGIEVAAWTIVKGITSAFGWMADGILGTLSSMAGALQPALVAPIELARTRIEQANNSISKHLQQSKKDFAESGKAAKKARNNMVSLSDSFWSITDSIKNGIMSIMGDGQELNIGGNMKLSQEVLDSFRFASNLLNNNLFPALQKNKVATQQWTSTFQFASQIMNQTWAGAKSQVEEVSGAARAAGQAMGQMFDQAVLHGRNFMGVLKNIIKQLASKIFVQGVMALITGGASLAKGSIGKAIFGGLFHGGGMVPGSGERMIRAKGGEMVLTASQQRALGGMMGGGGPTISPGAIGHAIGRELDKRLQRLSNNEIYAMAQKGRRAY